MKRKFVSLFTIFVLFLLVASPFLVKTVEAASTGTVNATVTAQIFSVSLDNSDGVAFGTVATSDTKDTTTGAKGVNDSTIATNNGSVAAKFEIKAANSTNWTLAASAGSENYTMKYCITTCDTSPSWVAVGIDPSYATLAASVAKDGTQSFDLQVGTPTSTTATGQQAVVVTVLATTP